MTNELALEAPDNYFGHLTENNQLMGGKSMLPHGDF